MSLSVVFMGTPEIAVPSLEALLQHGFDVRAVVTRVDAPQGRGRQLAPPPVKVAALRHGLPIFQPEKLRTPEMREQLAALEPDFFVVMAYGKILAPSFLALPRLAPINLHASLLPRHRGAAPIQWAIIDGDAQTGISVMKMEAGLDTGPVYEQQALAIGEFETSASLHDRLATLAAQMLPGALRRIAEGLQAQPQDEALATVARQLVKSDGAVDFDTGARALCKRICGLTPWPGAFCQFRGQRTKLLGVRWQADAAAAGLEAGQLAGLEETALRVATCDGWLLVDELQVEGRKAQSAAVFAAGYQPREDERLISLAQSPAEGM
ncbi:MAG: methionyl-tRNA formyltransferase [Myxococcota bacterium]|jgi:methionyl-tRNA formyltransferase|nr:methionyl-tRNA formyltransferase [Myxococcota bacterium]